MNREGRGKGGGGGWAEFELELENFMLKDSNVRSVSTYLTASPCYTTNTNKHDNTTNKYYKHD